MPRYAKNSLAQKVYRDLQWQARQDKVWRKMQDKPGRTRPMEEFKPPQVDRRILALAAQVLFACALGLEVGSPEKRGEYLKLIRSTAEDLEKMA